MASVHKKNNSFIFLLAVVVIVALGSAFMGSYAAQKTLEVKGDPDMFLSPRPVATNSEETANLDTEPTIPPLQSGISLTVISPEYNATVDTNSVVVSGLTAPKAEVFINDKETQANSKGDFSLTLSLDEGNNLISISVNDANGNFATQEFTVTYTPSQ